MKKKWRITLWVVTICVLAIVLAVILWHGAGKRNVRQPGEEQQNLDPNEIVTVWCLSEVWTGKVGEEKKLAYVYEYDANGNMLSQTTYWAEVFERNPSVHRYEFDDRGNLISQYDGEKPVVAYSYDERDNVLTKIEYDYYGEEWIRYVYTYDEQDRILTFSKFSNGELSWEDVNTYDAQGNLIREETYIDGKVENTKTYAYDQNGRIITSVYVDNLSPHLSSESYYQYDEMGNELSYKWYQAGKLRTERTNTYDLFGRLKTEKKIEDGRVSYEATYTYDGKGNLIRVESMQGAEIYVDDPGPLRPVVITYKYDQYGNKVEKVKDRGDHGTEVFTWVYDRHGNLLVEDYWDNHIERTYDEWGNILTKRHRPSSGPEKETEYTYVSFQVPRWLAEKIQAWQQEFLDKQGYV